MLLAIAVLFQFISIAGAVTEFARAQQRVPIPGVAPDETGANDVDKQILFAVVMNLLHNAFKLSTFRAPRLPTPSRSRVPILV